MVESLEPNYIAELNDQEPTWEASRKANRERWEAIAYHKNLFRSVLWVIGACVTTPSRVMEEEAKELNRQYDLEHS